MSMRGRARPTSGPDQQIRFARILGIAMWAGGFIAIGLGWNGMAKVACADCQLPYLLSGGAAGIGLIIVGTSIMIVGQFRAERMRFEEQVSQLTAALRARAAVPEVAALAAAPQAPTTVVVGRSTYHRPDCRLVRGKPDLEVVTVDVAIGNELSPCRVCNPSTPGAAGDGAAAGTTTGGTRGAILDTALHEPVRTGRGDVRRTVRRRRPAASRAAAATATATATTGRRTSGRSTGRAGATTTDATGNGDRSDGASTEEGTSDPGGSVPPRPEAPAVDEAPTQETAEQPPQ